MHLRIMLNELCAAYILNFNFEIPIIRSPGDQLRAFSVSCCYQIIYCNIQGYVCVFTINMNVSSSNLNYNLLNLLRDVS